MKGILTYFAFVFFLTFSACGKIQAFEIETPEERVEHQAELLDRLRGRLQVCDVSLHSDYYSVRFVSDEVFEFYSEGTPIFSISNASTWIVNGKDTQIPANYSSLPEVLIDENNSWIIDGIDTGLSAYENLNPEDVAKTIISYTCFIDRQFIVVLKDGTILQSPIVIDSFYHVPDYWLSTVVEQELEAEAVIEVMEGDGTAFVFFTDTHWGKNMKRSPALIRHIIDYTPIEDVIFGGDVVTTHSTNLVTPMETGRDFQESFSFLGSNFHCLYGNHDNNSDSQPNKTEYHLSDEQVFSFLQSQMTDVIFGDYFNFYYDNPITKTRIIGLDTGRYYYAQFRDKLPETVQFAIESLNSVPEGWHGLMARHIWCSSSRQSDGTYKQYLDSGIKPILKVFDDYNARTTGVYKYQKESITYDFSKAGGRVEFCIGGHTHGNYTTSSDGGIPVIIVISDYFATPDRGTTQEQSVTMVVADYKNRKLDLFVVGRGEDRHLEL